MGATRHVAIVHSQQKTPHVGNVVKVLLNTGLEACDNDEIEDGKDKSSSLVDEEGRENEFDSAHPNTGLAVESSRN